METSLERERQGENPEKKNTQDRMKKDKDYLRQLEKSFVPLPALQDGTTEKVAHLVKETLEYLDSREAFWKQLG